MRSGTIAPTMKIPTFDARNKGNEANNHGSSDAEANSHAQRRFRGDKRHRMTATCSGATR